MEIAALFRLWAQQALDGKAGDAKKTWNRTGATQDANPALLIYDLCGANRVSQVVLKAMLQTGNGVRIPAVAAVVIAANRAPRGTPGVFVMMVQASGHLDGDVFLNSENDYRDQRNLTVRILPNAQADLRKKYGEDLEAAFKGKVIEVMGAITRTKIMFRANGVDTGQYYYQTHIVVNLADQIQLLEDKPKQPDRHPSLDNRDLKT